ncbi:MAG: laminin G domain-containing protein [Candidatus Portnoybacteria bacterium]|nr:laminin G domain-containing protein [Candidatus Portnoybacteria bacterium]
MRITPYTKLLAILTLLLIVFPPGLIAAPGLARSAGAIWDLDDSGTRYDSVTQGVGPAAQFTSTNSEYLSIADNASLSIGAVSFTWAAWVYLDSKTGVTANLISKMSVDNEYYVEYGSTPDRFAFQVYSGPSLPSGGIAASTFGSPSTATWYFIVAWRDSVAQTINISINNGAVDSTTYSETNVYDGASELRIGRYGTTYYNGRIALVGLWKKVLSSAERTELYNSGKGYAYRDLTGSLKTSLISYWNLNESAGVRFDSQSSNDLTDNNTVTQATGVRGDNTLGRAATPYAAQFTSANSESLSIADNASLSVANADFSITAWVYFDSFPATSGQHRGVITKVGATSETEYSLFIQNNAGNTRFKFIVSADGGNGGGCTAGTSCAFEHSTNLATGTWYFVVAWHDATADTINIRVDDSVTTSQGWASGSNDGTNPFGIAQKGWHTQFFDGRIALVGFWKKVLSATERAHLYNGGKGLTYSELSRTLPSLTTSLNAYWNLYEASGTRADSAGSNNLADNNTVTQNAGVPRGTTGTVPTAAGRGKSSIAGQFTAANSEFLSMPGPLIASGNFSIAAWVYPGAFGNKYIMSQGTAATDRIIFNVNNFPPNNARCSVDGVGFVQTTTDLIANTWYWVLCTYDGTNVRVYVNNSLEATGAQTANYTATLFYIGQNTAGGAYTWDGRISKVGVWTKVLSAQERTDLYNSGRGNSYDGAAFYKDTGSTLTTSLTAWWELDELCCTRFDKVSPGAGPAAQFTSANSEYLSRADNADLSTGDIDFTISAWVWMDSQPANPMNIVTRQDSNSVREYQLVWDNSDNRFTFGVFDSAGNEVGRVRANSFGALSTNTWYFVVAGHRGGATNQVFIKVNGGTEDTASTTGAPSDTAASTRIGTQETSPIRLWNGRIALVGFWKRDLTSAEVTSLYNSGTGRNCKDLNDQLRRKLISYWNLNEGSGTRFDCVGANDLADNATVTQATGVAGGNSLGDNATVTHNQGLPWWTKARASGQFTSANSEYLSIADNADVSTGTSDFTWAAWVLFDTDADFGLINKSLSTGNQREYFLDRLNSNDRLRLCVSSDGTDHVCVQDSNFGATTTSTWYFVVGWADKAGDQIAIQTNNGTPTTASFTGAGFDSTTPLNIGRDQDAGPYHNGRIQLVGFWKKVLTAQERTDLYNSGKANRYNGNSFEIDTSGTLTTSLTAYWTLDEASGTRYDSKGANHLTDNNTVSQNVGIDASAAGQFTATNSEYLSIPDNAALSTGDIDFTFGGWVYFDSFPQTFNHLMVKWVGGGQKECQVIYTASTTNRFQFFLSSDGNTDNVVLSANNAGAAVAGAWYFVVVWHDAITDQAGIQINNGVPSIIPYSLGVRDGTAPVNFGAAGTPADYLNGRIDNAFFIKRVLTESERAALYNQGAGLSYVRLQKGFKKRGTE